MSDKIKRGKEGEDVAANYLIQKGYEIIERNYRHQRSEIDLIVRHQSFLVFVEVKTRSTHAFGHPEEAVDYRKVAKILEGAEHYIFDRDWRGPVRYDIVAITWKDGDEPEVMHIEDAFY